MSVNSLTQKKARYQRNLFNSAKAKAYLKNRGITAKLAREYELGYVPSNVRFTSLAGRILFPLLDYSGSVVTYQGRAISPKVKPKYYHTPYMKSAHIYGLVQILRRNPKAKRVVVVEGPVDVLILALFGIDAVCTFGTSFSNEHAFILASIFREVIFTFDNDETGRAAATQANEMLQPYHIESNIVFVPVYAKHEARDWSEFYTRNGKKITEKAIARCYAI